MVLIALIGCNNEILTNPGNYTTESARVSEVSKRIEALKEAGLLDSLLREQSARAVAETYLNDVDMDKLNFFISDTDEALAEIAQSENGDVQLRLIDAMFTGGTVGEIADIMAEISEDLANEYLNAMETQLEVLYEVEETQARSAYPRGDIKNIRLSFFDERNTGTTARGAYEANLNRDTVIWYGGFCAATVAGVYAATSGWPWISIPGIIAAVAGAGSMSIQLGVWTKCPPFLSLINSIIGKNPTELNRILLTGDGPALLTIGGLTVGTALACAFSPPGRAAIAIFKKAWNAMVAKIIAVTNINWEVFGIAFQPII
ncbi:MAG: hypothetical protein LBU16_03040 [Treponema sp.]|jgi:hypothetical protein|nr:hypothetical protein [Treponema sp.]